MAFGIDDAIAEGLKILNKFVPDPVEKQKAESELRNALLAWDQSQNLVNQEEAKNANIFVSGWRPAIGWVCSLALLYQYLLLPFILWGCIIFNVSIPKPPALDETLWQLMFGLLGLGGLRTYERIKGVARV